MAKLTGVERFVYSSSGCGVYGLDSKMPFEEHDISISLHPTLFTPTPKKFNPTPTNIKPIIITFKYGQRLLI